MNNSQESARRIVISGVGLLSPLGIGAERFWESLASCKSGIGPIETMSHSAAPHNVGGEVKGYCEKEAKKTWLKVLRKSVKVMCREIQLGVASASIALEDSGLNLDEIDHSRLGVDFGSNLMLSPPDVLKDACWNCLTEEGGSKSFNFNRWGGDGLPNMEPLWLLRYLPNMPACHIGIAADARGPNNSITLEEASGNLALGEAARIIGRGRADVMIAGTTGTRLHPVKTLHSAMWDELADSDDPPETWCKPFDANRHGEVVGEGACTFILEEETHARNRDAEVLGTILGIGSSSVADPDGTPHPRRALVNAMRAALKDAQLSPDEIGHLNANGLGTQQGDIEEALAIHDVFGAYAEKLPVTALKSYLGNSGSGCGTLELAGSLLALKRGVVPATLNFETPDPECPLNVVHGEPRSVSNKTVININFTRIGQASAIIVRGE